MPLAVAPQTIATLLSEAGLQRRTIHLVEPVKAHHSVPQAIPRIHRLGQVRLRFRLVATSLLRTQTHSVHLGHPRILHRVSGEALAVAPKQVRRPSARKMRPSANSRILEEEEGEEEEGTTATAPSVVAFRLEVEESSPASSLPKEGADTVPTANSPTTNRAVEGDSATRVVLVGEKTGRRRQSTYGNGLQKLKLLVATTGIGCPP